MAEAEDEDETSAIEEAAGEKLGVQRWDRPAIFRDAASAGTDNGLPYWMVLVLSGAIATLGLAINSSAVVIGAMLVAPLLAPVVGLALALAAGDGRLAVQTGAVVAGSTVAVVLTSALLTVLLPFQTITLEISTRARPTTLDLAVAVFSGLVAVVVTVARGSRLSAAIPGVAISVALIPPLAVTGFGIGSGWNGDLIYGSMLLYGANLAGIVLSGMLVFLLVGMQRGDVAKAALSWHERDEPEGLGAWALRAPWIRSMGVFSSPRARVGLVVGFVVALGVPLTESLRQITREARVEGAVNEAARLFDVHDRASIVSRRLVYGSGRTRVYLRVATTEWFGSEVREEFERLASAGAGEMIRLSLEQLPTRGEDLEQLASLLPGEERGAAAPPVPPAHLQDLLASARPWLRDLARELVPPEGVEIVGLELTLAEQGRPVVRLTYAAAAPLQSQAAEMLRGQIARSPELAEPEVHLDFVSTEPRPLSGTPADSVVLREIGERLNPGYRLAAELLLPEGADQDGAAEARRTLLDLGVPAERVRVRTSGGDGLRIRVVPAAPPNP
jgi:uncharacterized hydrophobic protein (TIGR00271 family)